MERNPHRVTVWARGKSGVPVTCTCGWRDYASTTQGAYSKKRTHIAQTQEAN